MKDFSFLKRLELAAKRILSKALTAQIVQRIVALAYQDFVPFDGMQFEASGSAGAPRTKCLLRFRMYESAEIRFIKRWLPLHSDVVELGASLGVTACIIRRLLPKEKRLVCVEPDEELCAIIRRNLQLNRLEGQVSIIHGAAVGVVPQSGCVGFKKSVYNTTGTTRYLEIAASAGTLTCTPAISLDDTVRIAGFETFSLVCDIEGAEWDLLPFSESLSRCNAIIIEFHEASHDPTRRDHRSLLAILNRRFGFEPRERYGHVYALSKRV